jgi:hypothetical protein
MRLSAILVFCVKQIILFQTAKVSSVLLTRRPEIIDQTLPFLLQAYFGLIYHASRPLFSGFFQVEERFWRIFLLDLEKQNLPKLNFTN